MTTAEMRKLREYGYAGEPTRKEAEYIRGWLQQVHDRCVQGEARNGEEQWAYLYADEGVVTIEHAKRWARGE